MPTARSQVVTVRRPRANRTPIKSTGSRQRQRPCNPAANHWLHSDQSLGPCQFAFAILGSPIVRAVVLQPQHDGRAFCHGRSVSKLIRKVQDLLLATEYPLIHAPFGTAKAENSSF